jgi:hypothetical protein
MAILLAIAILFSVVGLPLAWVWALVIVVAFVLWTAGNFFIETVKYHNGNQVKISAPPKVIIEERKHSGIYDRHSRKRQTPINDSVRIFIETYKKEQATNRHQEHREDRASKWIESLTLLFVIFTTVGIFYQDFIINNSDIAIHESADDATKAIKASIDSERARIFVTNADYIRSNENDTTPKIAFQLANLGRTSALVIEVSYECYITGDAVPLTPSYDPKKSREAMIAVGAGSIYTPPQGQQCELDDAIAQVITHPYFERRILGLGVSPTHSQ